MMMEDSDEDERRMLDDAPDYSLHYGQHIQQPGYDDSNGLPATPRENLFFFADYDFFRSPRYEFLSEKSDTKGYIFGLFVRDES